MNAAVPGVGLKLATTIGNFDAAISSPQRQLACDALKAQVSVIGRNVDIRVSWYEDIKIRGTIALIGPGDDGNCRASLFRLNLNIFNLLLVATSFDGRVHHF